MYVCGTITQATLVDIFKPFDGVPWKQQKIAVVLPSVKPIYRHICFKVSLGCGYMSGLISPPYPLVWPLPSWVSTYIAWYALIPMAKRENHGDSIWDHQYTHCSVGSHVWSFVNPFKCHKNIVFFFDFYPKHKNLWKTIHATASA